MKLKQIALAAAIAASGGAAFAQSTNVTLYGNIDQNISYVKAGSTNLTGMEDGGFLKSRIGFKGTEDLGQGLKATFNLEGGGYANTGAFTLFNRQSWVGLGSNSVGEFRAGLQNSAIFYRGGAVDYTERTLGSIVNIVGVPSRYGNDIAYISPRINNFLFETHYSMGGIAGDTEGNSVIQYALDYEAGPAKLGYAGIQAKPAASAANHQNIRYDLYYANYKFGDARVQAAFVSTNNQFSGNPSDIALPTTTAPSTTLGAQAPAQKTIWQLSADYRVSPNLRVGALYGEIKDQTGQAQGAKGGSIGAYYDLSKRTMLYGIAMNIKNEANGKFAANGSNGLSYNVTAAQAQGQTVETYTVGILHRF